jgi:nucleoside-diphosphate-sugar epimerase
VKVLLTGATGRIGSHTCRALVDAGFEVRATDRRSSKDLPVPIVVADVLDRYSCYRLCEGMDAVVHLANHPHFNGDAQRIYNDNVSINFNVFQAASEVGVKKLVYASSVQTINGDRQQNSGGEQAPSNLAYLPADGDLPANAANPYSLSKLAGEQQMQYFSRWKGMSCVAIRFPLTITGDWWNRAREQRANARKGSTGGGGGGFRWMALLDECFAALHAEDAGELVAAVLKADLPGFRVYMPAARTGMNVVPIPELIEQFYKNVPLKKPISEITSLVDISRIERETGWSPKHDMGT